MSTLGTRNLALGSTSPVILGLRPGDLSEMSQVIDIIDGYRHSKIV